MPETTESERIAAIEKSENRLKLEIILLASTKALFYFSMTCSIILPCLNEMRHGYIQRILPNLIDQQGSKEIIAVVSRSTTDGTEDFIAQYPQIKLVMSDAINRAQRLNQGIKISTGEIVLLHHPATLLPEVEALNTIELMIDRSTGALWGGFQHSFDLDHWLLRFTSWYADRIRFQRTGIVYLDHCIFARRDLLKSIDYVPDLDIFEDTLLSERLKAFGMPVLVDRKVITSARRFRDRGIYQQAILNQILKICYRLKVDPKYMNKLYEQKSSINVTYGKQESN